MVEQESVATEFRDLIAKQDWTVCELAQRGVRSRFYEHGVYPRHEKYLYGFNQRYSPRAVRRCRMTP